MTSKKCYVHQKFYGLCGKWKYNESQGKHETEIRIAGHRTSKQYISRYTRNLRQLLRCPLTTYGLRGCGGWPFNFKTEALIRLRWTFDRGSFLLLTYIAATYVAYVSTYEPWNIQEVQGWIQVHIWFANNVRLLGPNIFCQQYCNSFSKAAF